jgi:hypothetical protein
MTTLIALTLITDSFRRTSDLSFKKEDLATRIKIL